jgi:hypothetical protein
MSGDPNDDVPDDEVTPAPQDDDPRDDLPDNDPCTDGIDPDSQGGELPHTLEEP